MPNIIHFYKVITRHSGSLKETGISSVWKAILRPPSPTSNTLRGGAGFGEASCFVGATLGLLFSGRKKARHPRLTERRRRRPRKGSCISGATQWIIVAVTTTPLYFMQIGESHDFVQCMSAILENLEKIKVDFNFCDSKLREGTN
ncbi:hypothetical protein PUN28_004815 [Cardiocondyla obscurior]|uniref:Uncharacterized protein n=1 Tax=Cardiocondyla obscurior TaxID=286306 RepID=A0AAW2GD99_9HYME